MNAFAEADCVPVGGVAAGLGGSSGGSTDAAPFAASAGVAALAAAWLRRRRPADAG